MIPLYFSFGTFSASKSGSAKLMLHDSMLHSSLPRRILKSPFSPQSEFQEFAAWKIIYYLKIILHFFKFLVLFIFLYFIFLNYFSYQPVWNGHAISVLFTPSNHADRMASLLSCTDRSLVHSRMVVHEVGIDNLKFILN